MERTLKLLHLGGLVAFLGSVMSFVLVSGLGAGGSLEALAFGREIIRTGTVAVTLPGLWLLTVTGLAMGIRRYGLRNGYFLLKLALAAVILLNAHVLIVPAVGQATDLALQSLAHGELLPGYSEAYWRESLFGAVNVVLTGTAAVVAIWRIGAGRGRAAPT